MAGKRKPLDVELVRKLASIDCSWDEICSVIGLSRRTLNRHVAQVIEDARATGRMSLRRKQFEIAMEGNVQMLIWLGKQRLGQKDRTEIDIAKLPDHVLAEEAERRLGSEQQTKP